MHKFSISVDPATAFVRIKLSGFFTLDDVSAFAAEQLATYAILAADKGRHRTLCDVSDCKIQLQDVVEAFRQLLTNQDLMSARMAFVTGSSPAKMQIRRLITRDSCRFFETAAEAEQWLRTSDRHEVRVSTGVESQSVPENALKPPMLRRGAANSERSLITL
jgi:hypothetical protein